MRPRAAWRSQPDEERTWIHVDLSDRFDMDWNCSKREAWDGVRALVSSMSV